MKLMTKDVIDTTFHSSHKPRANRTPKNPHGVAVGQQWEMSDERESQGKHGYFIVVTAVNLRGGYAEVTTPYISKVRDGAYKTRRIRLDRFSPKHHYYLAGSF